MKSILRNLPNKGSAMFRKWAEEEAKLNQSLSDCKQAVHTALCGEIGGIYILTLTVKNRINFGECPDLSTVKVVLSST